MEQMITAVIAVAVIGIICAAVLVLASKLMAVKEDENFPKIRECLPGANCGACGFAGCDGYARALCEDGTTPANLCVPGGESVSKQLSALMGVEFAEVERKFAYVHCSGDCAHTQDKVNYLGMKSCKGSKLLYGGKGSCVYGCLGYGDCIAVCPQEAISIIDGVARVDRRLCIGCGLCVKACPNKLIQLVPDTPKVLVACSNRDKGVQTRKACTNGCFGCKKCERTCPNGGVSVIDNLAVVNYEKCKTCQDFGVCTENCPAKVIRIDAQI